jgi:hypothetical protein
LKAHRVNSGAPLASASMIRGIPCRAFREWVSREGYPLKEPQRNAVLPADAEKQLHQRIVRLHVGFGITLNHIRRFAV